jgi:hypothetical protein
MMLLRVSLVMVILAVIVLPYMLDRLDNLNSVFIDDFGLHPKLFAVFLFVKTFLDDSLVFFAGGGLGNVSGTAAIWANQSINEISSHTPINIPGLFESEIHKKTIGIALSIIEKDPWAVHSSLNRPYFTYLSILFEFGIFMGVMMLYLFFRSILHGGLESSFAKILAVFFCFIFALDNLHSNPLFWGVILVGMRALVTDNKAHGLRDDI